MGYISTLDCCRFVFATGTYLIVPYKDLCQIFLQINENRTNGSLIGTGPITCRGYMAKYLPGGFMAYLEI